MSKQRRADGKFAPGNRGNPYGRRGKPRQEVAVAPQPSQITADAWYSILSGIGDSRYDKRYATVFDAPRLVTSIEAQHLWRGNDLAARTVEFRPKDMLRQGFELQCDDKTLVEDVQGKWEELKFPQRLFEGLCRENAYGGAGILLGAIDGSTDWAQPLDEETVRDFTFLTVLEPAQLTPSTFYVDPLAPKYNEVETYLLTPRARGTSASGSIDAVTRTVHESRLIVFPGTVVSVDQVSEFLGWGDSIFTRVWPVLRDYGMTWESAALLMSDFAQAIYKVKDLNQIYQSDDRTALKNRMQMVELARSTARAVIIDAEEEFERKATPITGLPDFLDRFSERYCVAIDVPRTKFFGTSPGGLNATGDSDTRNYYDSVRSEQTQRLTGPIEKVVRLIMRALGAKEPNNWSIRFCPLWQSTDKEDAELRKMNAETDQIYVNLGVYSPEEVAVSRFGGDRYGSDITIDFDNRQAIESLVPPAQQVAMLEAENQEEGDDEAFPEEAAQEDREDALRQDRVERRGSKWLVLSMSGRVLGEHDTEAEAMEHLRVIEYKKREG